MTAMLTQERLKELKLPDGIHAAILMGCDVNGVSITHSVVWTNRVSTCCSRCRQPVPIEVEVPVVLNPGVGGGQLDAVSMQHECGQWLGVSSGSIVLTSGDEKSQLRDIADIAKVLAVEYAERVNQERERIRAELRRDLETALSRLATPLSVDETADDRASEVTTGSESEPGVYCAHEWIAWAYGPDGEELVTVCASDLGQGGN